MDSHDPLSDSMGLPLMPEEPGKKRTFVSFMRSRFVTGILVALPLVITLFFARFLFNLLDRWSYPISARVFGFSIPGLGAVLAVVLIFGLGWIAHSVIGRRLLRLGENVIARFPVLGPVYVGTREVTRALSSERSRSFRRVVLIPYPIEGAWCLAFVTAEFDVPSERGLQRMVSVFMPSTPNPTTGFYLLYPLDRIRSTSLTVEAAARMVISGGILAPNPGAILPTLERTPGSGNDRTGENREGPR